ncbi:uncharacterized protein LOC107413049 isoform X1 [Ziziphus jujuba]|uniref:Uncharacterized protein LOC107413049 isoform X1 n=1 Tax=Ziziphus jujuba TaxID=326968 RepID=A0A6P3ZM66_ZIZJJ|nr:uncharacterized protein LOC107413049 isoform X1 [Ziziphus jujuba]
MAAFDYIKDMYDIALKPRLLRTLIRDHVPNEKHPFGSPSELSMVVSAIKTHNLLSEYVREPTDQKVMDTWRAAVDSWVNRLLELVSSDMPDKCWAGICLLGMTCQECSSDRFLASYSVWFQKLLSHIQSAAASHFLKIASCASMSDMLTRLGGFPNLKKDGTAHAGKVIQPVLKLLNDVQSEAVLEGANILLCTIITFFPFSISRHYESVEAAIASKMLSGNCSVNIFEKLAHSLALLPKSRGDEDSWSLMMQKILLLINYHLNDAFQGFEDEMKSNEAIRLLVPPGKDRPPLGGLALLDEESYKERRRSAHLLISSVSTLMLCCCKLLTSSYPVQVTVPVRSLLALVERVLMVNGSLPLSVRPLTTAMQQEFISSELPVLHSYGLELLTAIVKGVRSQLLPHAASVVRLISVYFKKCALPELRKKIYSITRILLISMGVGMAVCLAQEVINNAFVDLNPTDNETGGASSGASSNTSTEALPQAGNRKRKHGTTMGSLQWHDRSSSDTGATKNHPVTLISLKIAALEALEALLTVGGALRSEGWRSNVDLLIMNIATNSLKGGWANEPTEVWANLQLAALRALLASFLSSSRVRSPYLAQGLELFRKGKQETGTKLAEFCAHALLALEVLIHPRVLPLEDFLTANSISNGVHHRFPESLCSDGLENRTTFSSGKDGIRHSSSEPDHDDLYECWLGNGKETELPVSTPGNTTNDNDKPSETVTVHLDKKLPVESGSFNKEILDVSDKEPLATSASTEKKGNGDETMIDSHQFQESITQVENSVSAKISTFPATIGGSLGTEIVSEKVASFSEVVNQAGNDMASGLNVLVDKTEGFTKIDTGASMASIPEKSKAFASEADSEYEMEAFPDIVDVDPDSEYE